MALRTGNGKYAAFNEPLDSLKSFLERRFELPIVDRTGLTNKYDYAIKWDEPDPKKQRSRKA